MIVFAKPIKFAALFIFGNLLRLAHQMEMVFDIVRVLATVIIYHGCMVIDD